MNHKQLIKVLDDTIKSINALAIATVESQLTPEQKKQGADLLDVQALILGVIGNDLLAGYMAFVMGDELPSFVSVISRELMRHKLMQEVEPSIIKALTDRGVDLAHYSAS
jgi:hypothetical protein